MVYYILHKLNINIISLTKTWGIKWFSDKLCSNNVNIRECCWPVVSSYEAHSIFVSYACHSTPLKQARVPSLAWFSDKLCSNNVNIRECCWPVVSSYEAHSIFVSYACHSTPLKQARVPSLALRTCFCIWGPFCKDPIMTWLEYHVAELHFLWFWNLALFFARTTFTALMFHVLVFRSVIIGLYKTTSHLTYLDNVLNESKTLCLLDFIFPWMDSTLTFVRSLQWQLFAVIALGRFRPHCVNTFTAKFSQKQISTKFPTPSSTLAVKGLIREQWPLSGVTPDRDGGGVNLRPQPSLHLPTITNPTRPLDSCTGW